MFASTPSTAIPYCSIHGKLFLESVQAWCSLQSTHIPSLYGNPKLPEAPCDECMTLGHRTFTAQLPPLCSPRTLQGLGKDLDSDPPRLPPSDTVSKVS